MHRSFPEVEEVYTADLGSSDGPPRNWKGIGIAMLVILAVMSLVILSVIVLTPDESHLLLRSHITMEDLESEKFKVHDPCVAWLNENEVALRTREGYILSFSLNNNLTSTLLDNSSLSSERLQREFSSRGHHVETPLRDTDRLMWVIEGKQG
ncbi:hypothetical protein NQZ68_039869 [Dissostichus eleginoides]|nr:hypothetical protein NQZ68_039869 [Dissostichus eleginoides]